jgi:hypothetical protein
VEVGAGIGAVLGRLQPKNQRKRLGKKMTLVPAGEPAVLNQVEGGTHYNKEHVHVAGAVMERELEVEVGRSCPNPGRVKEKTLAEQQKEVVLVAVEIKQTDVL